MYWALDNSVMNSWHRLSRNKATSNGYLATLPRQGAVSQGGKMIWREAQVITTRSEPLREAQVITTHSEPLWTLLVHWEREAHVITTCNEPLKEAQVITTRSEPLWTLLEREAQVITTCSEPRWHCLLRKGSASHNDLQRTQVTLSAEKGKRKSWWYHRSLRKRSASHYYNNLQQTTVTLFTEKWRPKSTRFAANFCDTVRWEGGKNCN